MRYPRGTEITFRGTFKDLAGELSDPTVVTFSMFPQNGAPEDEQIYVYLTDDEVLQDSPGVYSIALTPGASGQWFYRWKGEGGLTVTSLDIPFVVEITRFTP